jgi:hypothetical protein
MKIAGLSKCVIGKNLKLKVLGARSIAFQALYSSTKNLRHCKKIIFEIYGL